MRRTCILGFILGTLALFTGCTSSQTMPSRIGECISIWQDVQASGKGPTSAEVNSCVGMAIVRSFEGGLVVGGSGGSGILVKRNGTDWSEPVAISVSSGSFGAQIGMQSIRAVMLFRHEDAFDKFINDGSYFDAGASGAAGTATGQTSAAGPAVQTFAVGSGLMGKATIGGLGVKVDAESNTAAYGEGVTVADILAGKAKEPAGMQALLAALKVQR